MPPRFSPRLARLIAAALLLQWLSLFAPLAVAAPAGSGPVLHLEICTPEGLRSIALGDSAGDGETAPATPPCLVHCALMLAPAASLPPAPLTAPAPREAGLRAPPGFTAAPAERPELYAHFLARAPPAA